MKLNEAIKETYVGLLKEVRTLELNEEKQKSRITFSNANRVVAVEARKHYVLLHLPKRANLLELIKTVKEGEKEVDHIEPFKMSYDSRGWSYIRVSKPADVSKAIEVIQFAKTHN